MARLETPSPTDLPPLTLLEFQSRRGPPLGQVLSKPVSVEMASRLGPRHCGQSPGSAFNCAWRGVITRRAAKTDATRRCMEGGSFRRWDDNQAGSHSNFE